jgi:filamentous hemagglutinin
MGGLAAEATGADFRTGALAAGANEALMSTLLKQYDSMSLSEKKSLITMNSQLIGVVAAATLGEDEKGLQTGAWVAGNGTKYNEFGIYDLVPPGAVKYGQAATSLGQEMAVQGASPEEVSTALQAMARGDGYDGPDPAKEFLKAWATTVLTGGGMLGNGARLGSLALGATIGGGANVSYQLSTDLSSISYTDATVAAIVGALSQGRGFLATEAISVSGAYVGSQVKGTDPTGAMIGAGVGTAAGAVAGKVVKDSLPSSVPNSLRENFSAIVGSATSEGVGPLVVEEKKSEK